jgi:hypothetical protein
MDEYDIPKPVPARPDPPPPGYPGYAGQPGYPPAPGHPGYPLPPGYPPPGYPPQPGYPGYPGYPPDAGDGWSPARPSAPTPPPASTPRGSHRSGPPRPGGGGARPAARSRSTLGAFLTTIGCLAGSLAVAAFVIATLVVNPERPGQVVKAVLGTSAGRSVATDAIASTLRQADPSLTPVQAATDAKAIVASPSLAASLGSSKANVSSALLTELKQVDPAAAAAVSAHASTSPATASPLSALPTQALSAASHVHSVLRSIALLLLIVGVAAVGMALLIGPRRDRVLLRVGLWALAASAVQLAIWLGLPALFGHFTNPWSQVAAAALRAGSTGLLTVFVTLAVAGAIAVALGLAGRVTGHLVN